MEGVGELKIEGFFFLYFFVFVFILEKDPDNNPSKSPKRPPRFNYLRPSRRSLTNLQLVRASTDTYARKYGYITYQVFIPSIPSFSAKMYISTLFFSFEINNPSANTYALKYGYITYQV